MSKSRFDDVGLIDANGFYEYAYRGYNYEIVSGAQVFHVRTYDDDPGVALVMAPTNARTRPEARELVDFIVTSLGCPQVKFYDPDAAYRLIDTQTLEFIE